MIRLTLAVSTLALVLAGCDRPAPKPDPRTMKGVDLQTELRRCKELGLKAYDDADCKRAQQESNDRFLGKSSEPSR